MLLRVCVWACTKARVESQTAPTGCSLTQTFLAASFFFFFLFEQVRNDQHNQSVRRRSVKQQRSLDA